MTRRSGRWHALALIPAAALTGAADAPSPAHGAAVTVTITDLRNAKGVVRACMTGDRARFPRCRGDGRAYRTAVAAQDGRVTLTFPDVAPGRYAIALLHDENGNGEADRALGMMPTEGFGFSRDAPVRMGPPEFDDAVVEIGPDGRRLAIRMRYLL